MNARIDYEAEYNNRARVPEHPAIMEGWRRDAEAWRVEHPPQVVPYGPGERQVIDFFPALSGEPSRATVVFIHGGYWQALDRSWFSHLARGLQAHRINVAIPSYDLCPAVRVGDIVDEMRAACRELARFDKKLVVAGHSAGGHLAACMLATHWPAVDEGLPAGFVTAAYAISGLFDLKPLIGTSINGALKLDEAEAELASPLSWTPPAGLALDAVVGSEESAEYHRQSATIVERWGAAGVATRYETIAGANHFTVIAPLADPGSAMTRRVAALALG